MSKQNQGATDAQTGSQEPAPNQQETTGGEANTPTSPPADPAGISADAKAKADADAKTKKKPDADAKAKADAEARAAAEAAKPKRVRVICEGTLGSKLLEKGTITDHPEYVAILEQKGQKKVELVK